MVELLIDVTVDHHPVLKGDSTLVFRYSRTKPCNPYRMQDKGIVILNGILLYPGDMLKGVYPGEGEAVLCLYALLQEYLPCLLVGEGDHLDGTEAKEKKKAGYHPYQDDEDDSSWLFVLLCHTSYLRPISL